MGHLLVECTVMFNPDPPEAKTIVSVYPVVAYELRPNGSYEPLLISGRIPGWGDCRASATGGRMYGICDSILSGVTTATGNFPSIAQFAISARNDIAFMVDEIRLKKGHQPEGFAWNLIDSTDSEDINDWLVASTNINRT